VGCRANAASERLTQIVQGVDVDFLTVRLWVLNWRCGDGWWDLSFVSCNREGCGQNKKKLSWLESERVMIHQPYDENH